jgi:hypothetical protein
MKTSNFNTEKVAYSVTVLLFTLVFLISYTNETFYPAWRLVSPQRQNSANLYMTFLVMKVIEVSFFGTCAACQHCVLCFYTCPVTFCPSMGLQQATSFTLYALDDTQTYVGYSQERMQLVADWSNTRYLVFTLMDTATTLWLIINCLFVD